MAGTVIEGYRVVTPVSIAAMPLSDGAAAPADHVTPPPWDRLGVNIPSIGVDVDWWRGVAMRAEEIGVGSAWCWDHFISRGTKSDPVLELWTTLTAAATSTRRIRLGSFVANVMNRHPALLARMAATFQEVSGGRLILGMGIGGYRAEHLAYGMPFPDAAERAARLEDAVAVLRALWTGGPVTRASPFYPLERAWGYPRPEPAPPIVIGGQTRTGARLAARIADGWTAFETFARDLPAFEETLRRLGRSRADVATYAALRVDVEEGRDGEVWLTDPRAELGRWRARGADHVIVNPRRRHQVEPFLEALERQR